MSAVYDGNGVTLTSYIPSYLGCEFKVLYGSYAFRKSESQGRGGVQKGLTEMTIQLL